MFDFKNKIFNLTSAADFNELALEIFQYQYKTNSLYKDFVDMFNIDIYNLEHYSKIPFLPVDFFKTHEITTGHRKTEQIFLSSGTGKSVQSKHYVTDVNLYVNSFRKAFEYFYGDIKQYSIFALLPSYLEKEGSSLIFMINDLIKQSKNSGGFYLNNTSELIDAINKHVTNEQKLILFGVSYALLDLSEKYTLNIPNLIVMETGGMKGRRKEIIREELHSVLCNSFGVDTIHSEYGMTELLSQSYSKANGNFHTPLWMKVLIRDINDPVTIVNHGHSGGINVIDLANYNSCSFIATQDLGKLNEDGSFSVLGRFDYSDIRGCNLLIT
ncbi:MAG: acyltransferase [Bacteroidales bacterium]|nr:acyltransferase [Bacteroidales bacterium]